MIDKKIAFIGCGNMAQGIIKGLLKNGALSKNIFINNLRENKGKELANELNIKYYKDKLEMINDCDILFLAIKPNVYPKIIEEIKKEIKENIIVISIAPGYTLEDLKKLFEKDLKVVRAMPNTPATIGESMTAYVPSCEINIDDEKIIYSLLESFGKVEKIEEYLMDAFVAASGSSPAYIYMLIEAMADAAVLGGIPRDKAYIFVAQAVLGSAKMVLETGIHPAKLKDMVCSPGGTTIEGVVTLEKEGFRNSIIEAMIKCMEKSKKMNMN